MEQAKKALRYSEHAAFGLFLLAWEIVILVIYSVWFTYPEGAEAVADGLLYGMTRDVCIMIFFGFGFLMTFLRRYGFSAIGYSFLIAAIVCQWSIILQKFFEEIHDGADFDHRLPVGVFEVLNGLFCSGAVLITFGAVIGKVNPFQLMVIAFIEPVFFWVNFYVIILTLEALDIGGGMFIHTFGCYFGMALTLFTTSKRTKGHPDNTSCYSSDIFSLAGTLFLFMMWPSFNAVTAVPGAPQVRALVNTYLSLFGATVATFVISRSISHGKFEIVHIQNSTLAGGVMMGVAADLDISPAAAIACGLVAGTVSVFGFRFLTPFLSRRLGMQDICGIHNLHGMPGVLGSILAIFATAGLGQHEPEQSEFPHGSDQAGYQTAALFITLGIGIGSGLLTGVILFGIDFICKVPRDDLFNDRGFWQLPSDYEWVVDRDEDIEMDEMGNKRDNTYLRPHKPEGEEGGDEESGNPRRRIHRTGSTFDNQNKQKITKKPPPTKKVEPKDDTSSSSSED